MNSPATRRLALCRGGALTFFVWASAVGIADFFRWLPPSLLDAIKAMAWGLPILGLVVWRLSGANRLRLGLLSGAVVAALVLSELLFQGLLIRPYLPYDEATFEGAIASSWREPVPIERSPERFRIVGLGDSFGRAGEDKNFHYLLEDRLNASEEAFEMVNISMAAVEIPHERKLLERFGMRYHPDLVIHSFFIGNDFMPVAGDYMDFGGIRFHAQRTLRGLRPYNFSLSQWLHRFSTLTQERWRRRNDSPDETAGTFSEAAFLGIERRKLRLCEEDGRHLTHLWNICREHLHSLHRRAVEDGATLVLVIHPDQLQVETGLRERLVNAFGVDFSKYQLDMPQRILREYAQQYGIHVIDLLADFQEKGSEGGLYLERDTHYNEAGNALAAQLIADSLMEHVLPQLQDKREAMVRQ